MDEVILVDEKDNPLGTAEKLYVHKHGLLHRAFSLILFNSRGEMLIHQRAMNKYHSGGLWTNACCSHPRPGEPIKDAVIRRTREELGIIIPPPVFKGTFIYKITLNEHLSEHELDHVFELTWDEKPVINSGEIMDYRYVPLAVLKKEVNENPHIYTFWFMEILKKFYF